jgi:hypothetical protein
MRVFFAAAIAALLAGPVYAQTKPVPQYGEEDQAKTPQEISAEKEAAAAYKRSLGRIPEQKASDPWGAVRGDSAPNPAKDKSAKGKPAKDPAAKGPAAKDPAAKRAKAGGTAN